MAQLRMVNVMWIESIWLVSNKKGIEDKHHLLFIIRLE
jgi:hypothetical protein